MMVGIDSGKSGNNVGDFGKGRYYSVFFVVVRQWNEIEKKLNTDSEGRNWRYRTRYMFFFE